MKVIKAERVVHGSDWDDMQIVTEELDPVDVEISELEQLKVKLAHYQLMFDQQQQRVIDMLEEREEKTHISVLDGGRQATVVYGETVVYDEAAILEAVQEPLRHLITDEKINRKKLEAEVLRGTIDAHLVAEHATVKPRKPFLKLSEHRETEQES